MESFAALKTPCALFIHASLPPPFPRIPGHYLYFECILCPEYHIIEIMLAFQKGLFLCSNMKF